MTEPFFPFTIRAYETPSATSEGFTAHNPNDFYKALEANYPVGEGGYYAFDVTIHAPTEVTFTTYDMRDTCYGGIGRPQTCFPGTVDASITRKHIERRALALAKDKRSAELARREEIVIAGYAKAMLEAIEPLPDLDMTAEGYVREFVARDEVSCGVRLARWEQAYQDAGLIDAAWRAGYIDIGRDVACTITVLPAGRALLEKTNA